MTKEEQLQDLMEQFYSIVNRTNQLRNTPVQLAGCEPVNIAAIHLIETIGNHESINMTEVSERIGITKGAVSQMTTKLVHKGFLQKLKSPHSEKDIYLSLTESGQAIFQAHHQLHHQLYSELAMLLDEFSDHDLKRITLFMDRIETYMKEYAHGMI